MLWAGGFFEGDAGEDRFAGGLHWQALAGALLEGVLATCLCLWAVSHFRRHEARYHRPLVRRMAPSAYGAFVVHPPILVGLAFALAPLPLPPVVKFAVLVATGVAGSFGLVALGRRVLDHRGEALADADAHRRHAVAAAAAAQLVGERADQAGARAARAGGRARSRRRSRSGGRGRSPSSRIEASTWEANASFSSTRSMSFGSRPARSSAFRVEGTGPMPITAGSTPADALLTIRASGSRPSSRARSSLATTTHAAPSLICDALPAVTVPPSRKIGLQLGQPLERRVRRAGPRRRGS